MPGATAPKFRQLDSFTQGYIGAMFFTDTPDDEERNDWTFTALAPETLQRIIDDCINFQAQATGPLVAACSDDEIGYECSQAGRDFWFTRNRHGAGFWDRNLGTAGEALTAIAELYDDIYPYLGDDGLIHF